MIKTFKLTASEVADKVNCILKNNSEAKVLEVKIPEQGNSTLSMQISYGIYLEELVEIGETFGDADILVSSFDDFDGIALFMQPKKDDLWQVKGGDK